MEKELWKKITEYKENTKLFSGIFFIIIIFFLESKSRAYSQLTIGAKPRKKHRKRATFELKL